MRSIWLTAALFLLVACTDSDEQQTSADEASPLKKEAKEWVQQTKELGTAAMDSAKDAATSAGEKTQQYYDSAKQSTAAAYSDVKEKTREYYDAAKAEAGEITDKTVAKSGELVQQAKEKGTEMWESGKADMATREGHPPALGDDGALNSGQTTTGTADGVAPTDGQ